MGSWESTLKTVILWLNSANSAMVLLITITPWSLYKYVVHVYKTSTRFSRSSDMNIDHQGPISISVLERA